MFNSQSINKVMTKCSYLKKTIINVKKQNEKTNTLQIQFISQITST